jgi:hypothetical protein
MPSAGPMPLFNGVVAVTSWLCVRSVTSLQSNIATTGRHATYAVTSRRSDKPKRPAVEQSETLKWRVIELPRVSFPSYAIIISAVELSNYTDVEKNLSGTPASYNNYLTN